jgi:hypothetical protein
MFDEWYRNYPRKVAKGAARKAWEKTEKIRPPLEKMLKVLELQKKTEQWRSEGGKYIPHPATYLNQERWDDELEVDLGEDVVEHQGKIVNWWETATGIENKGLQLGLRPSEFDSWPNFKAEVMRRTMKAA